MTRLEKIKHVIEKIENQPIKFDVWLISFVAIIFVRLFEEIILYIKELPTNNFIWHDLVHIFLVFVFVNLMAYVLFKKTLKLNSKAFLNLSLIGTFFLSIVPPLIDFLVSKKHDLINFYEFYSLKECFVNFFTFLQQDPLIGTTPGQRVGIAVAVFVVGLYSFIKSSKVLISLTNVFLFYVIFYIVSTLPSWITFLVEGFDSSRSDVAALFFSPTDFLNQPAMSMNISLHKKVIFSYVILLMAFSLIIFIKNKIFQELLKNIRPVQTIYHLGLFSIGLGLAMIFSETVNIFSFFNIIALIVMVLVIVAVWFSSVFVNDYFDEKIDKISNPKRPLVSHIVNKSDYLKIGVFIFIFSIIMSLLINLKITILLSFYYSITLIYNVPPLRLKKIPLVATFISALASTLIIFSGYLMIVSENNLSDFPLNIIYLLLITYTISLPLKDFKDIEGDKKDNVLTLPVIFGEKTARLIVGVNVFVSFMLSVYFLSEKKLVYPALLFGLISFLLINFSKNNKFFINARKIVPVIFSLVFVYGLVLVWIVFF